MFSKQVTIKQGSFQKQSDSQMVNPFDKATYGKNPLNQKSTNKFTFNSSQYISKFSSAYSSDKDNQAANGPAPEV